jgi:hypothetical protein
MTINGKAENFDLQDLEMLGSLAGLKKKKTLEVIKRVWEAIKSWRKLAEIQGIDPQRTDAIGKILDDGVKGIIQYI